jgi:hypothetical protein
MGKKYDVRWSYYFNLPKDQVILENANEESQPQQSFHMHSTQLTQYQYFISSFVLWHIFTSLHELKILVILIFPFTEKSLIQTHNSINPDTWSLTAVLISPSFRTRAEHLNLLCNNCEHLENSMRHLRPRTQCFIHK